MIILCREHPCLPYQNILLLTFPRRQHLRGLNKNFCEWLNDWSHHCFHSVYSRQAHTHTHTHLFQCSCHCWKHFWKSSFGITRIRHVMLEIMSPVVSDHFPAIVSLNSQKSHLDRLEQQAGSCNTGMFSPVTNYRMVSEVLHGTLSWRSIQPFQHFSGLFRQMASLKRCKTSS
jgi:hypothetical protein